MVGKFHKYVDGIISAVRMNCALSGGCGVYKTGETLTCGTGGEEICWITQEEGRDANIVRKKILDALD